jgi:diguanylate cyclase (GGDEF)-like protein
VAFFVVLFGGPLWALGALAGMSLVALHLHLPLPMAAGAALGAWLEALLPVLLLRALGFDPRLERIRDVMLFICGAVLIGPLFTASLGTLGLSYAGVSLAAGLSEIWLLWWLGNSVGCLVIAGLLLVLATSVDNEVSPRCRLLLLSLLGGVALTSMLSVMQLSVGQPTLLLFALVPLIVFAATYCGRQGAMLLSFAATAAALVAMRSVPRDAYASHMMGLFSLDVALIWVAAFTGLVVASAYSERGAGAMYAYLAEHDGLTRLINRVTFEQRLARAIEDARRDGRPQVHALMFIDLDDFKQVNDRFGHAAGDKVLCHISRLLTSQVRSRDTVARLGGDEFVVLLENCAAASARQMAERIAAAVREFSLTVGDTACRVTTSIGVVPIGAGSGTMAEVLAAADRAHYRAKDNGKDRVHPDFVGEASG